jgi:hypothetical protein
MNKSLKLNTLLIGVASLLISVIFVAPSQAAVDCSKAPDSKTPACVIANQNKNVAEEVDASAAVSQKAAGLAARKAAEAKASKKPVVLTTPIATVSSVPKPTPTTSKSVTPTPTATATPTPSVTPSLTPTPSVTPTPSSTPTPVNSSAGVVHSAKPRVSSTPVVVQSEEPAQPAPVVSKKAAKSKASKKAKPAAKKSTKAKPAATTKTKSSGGVKFTVSCTNGSKVIKVTSAAPSCPAGYHRK